jgi:hypothetical protein
VGYSIEERRPERPVQIVCDYDRVETLVHERPGATFEIRRARGHVRHAAKRFEGRGIAVDGQHVCATLSEQARMASIAACDVENAAPRRD